MFALAAKPIVRATASVKASKGAPKKEQKSSGMSSKAAGAAAALFLFASPAMAGDGLVLQYQNGAAPSKRQQFFDPRRVVITDKNSSAEIGTDDSRVAPNKQTGFKNCKTITGNPCEASSQPTMQ
uniref:Uncharacterized protein n=1 Tax=Mantoniella antarctica TaxID=81844 RepID=A0A7S0X6Y3_9CHLO